MRALASYFIAPFNAASPISRTEEKIYIYLLKCFEKEEKKEEKKEELTFEKSWKLFTFLLFPR